MGGSGGAPQRRFGRELPKIQQGYDFQIGNFNQFAAGNPQFQSATNIANTSAAGLPGQVSDIQGVLRALPNISTLTNPLQSGLNQEQQIIQRGGAPTQQEAHDVAAFTNAQSAAQGNAHGGQNLALGVLNYDRFRRQNLTTAEGQARGLTGAISGLRGADIAQRLGGESGIQSLQTGAENQQLGLVQSESNVFAQTTNPILSYLSNLFGQNLQAASAQQQANTNKTAGIESGIISSIGQVAGAAAGASDERLKEKIRATGLSTMDGIPIKTFAYKSDPKKRWIGVVAQDVEKVRPEAVIHGPLTGMKYVNLSAIKAPFMEVEEAYA